MLCKIPCCTKYSDTVTTANEINNCALVFFFFSLQLSTRPLEASTRGNKSPCQDSRSKSFTKKINSLESHTLKNKISSVSVEGKMNAHFQTSASICMGSQVSNVPQFLFLVMVFYLQFNVSLQFTIVSTNFTIHLYTV